MIRSRHALPGNPPSTGKPALNLQTRGRHAVGALQNSKTHKTAPMLEGDTQEEGLDVLKVHPKYQSRAAGHADHGREKS